MRPALVGKLGIDVVRGLALLRLLDQAFLRFCRIYTSSNVVIERSNK